MENPKQKKLNQVTAIAKKLRQEQPLKYGMRSARPGDTGYVKNGWKMALADAGKQLGGRKGVIGEKKAISKLTAEQKKAKRQYRKKLRELQAEFFPKMGRTLTKKKNSKNNNSDSDGSSPSSDQSDLDKMVDGFFASSQPAAAAAAQEAVKAKTTTKRARDDS